MNQTQQDEVVEYILGAYAAQRPLVRQFIDEVKGLDFQLAMDAAREMNTMEIYGAPKPWQFKKAVQTVQNRQHRNDIKVESNGEKRERFRNSPNGKEQDAYRAWESRKLAEPKGLKSAEPFYVKRGLTQKKLEHPLGENPYLYERRSRMEFVIEIYGHKFVNQEFQWDTARAPLKLIQQMMERDKNGKPTEAAREANETYKRKLEEMFCLAWEKKHSELPSEEVLQQWS